jgi:hypothetical protein
MIVANSVLWRIAIILKVNKVDLFVSSVLFVSWYHSPNILDTPRTSVTNSEEISYKCRGKTSSVHILTSISCALAVFRVELAGETEV